jgi:predicted aldo/keto reductase-like oxidoreductase
MEPLKGGKLTDSLPPTVQKYWDKLDAGRTPAEWALRWVANFPEVMTILSGVSNLEQTKENVDILSRAEANGLTGSDLEIISQVAEEYNKLTSYPCTSCRYCMPCPAGINIPSMLEFRNSWDIYGGATKLKEQFDMFVEKRPSLCTSCRSCEEKCPQHLSIAQAMGETTAIYE